MIKPISIESVITLFYPGDPAVDRGAETEIEVPDPDAGVDGAKKVVRVNALAHVLARSRESDFNPVKELKRLRMRDGEKPTEFVVGVIPPEDMNAIGDECMVRINTLSWRAFLAALRDVRNGPTAKRRVDGVERDVVPTQMVNGIRKVDPDWLRETFVRENRDVALWIGMAAWRWNRFGDVDAKN